MMEIDVTHIYHSFKRRMLTHVLHSGEYSDLAILIKPDPFFALSDRIIKIPVHKVIVLTLSSHLASAYHFPGRAEVDLLNILSRDPDATARVIHSLYGKQIVYQRAARTDDTKIPVELDYDMVDVLNIFFAADELQISNISDEACSIMSAYCKEERPYIRDVVMLNIGPHFLENDAVKEVVLDSLIRTLNPYSEIFMGLGKDDAVIEQLFLKLPVEFVLLLVQSDQAGIYDENTIFLMIWAYVDRHKTVIHANDVARLADTVRVHRLSRSFIMYVLPNAAWFWPTFAAFKPHIHWLNSDSAAMIGFPETWTKQGARTNLNEDKYDDLYEDITKVFTSPMGAIVECRYTNGFNIETYLEETGEDEVSVVVRFSDQLEKSLSGYKNVACHVEFLIVTNNMRTASLNREVFIMAGIPKKVRSFTKSELLSIMSVTLRAH